MGRIKRLVVPMLLGVAVYYAIFGGSYSVFEQRQARAEVVEARAELRHVQLRIDSLSAWADSLEHDSATVERIARERFGMIREGETLYRFVPEDGEAGRQPVPAR